MSSVWIADPSEQSRYVNILIDKYVQRTIDGVRLNIQAIFM